MELGGFGRSRREEGWGGVGGLRSVPVAKNLKRHNGRLFRPGRSTVRHSVAPESGGPLRARAESGGKGLIKPAVSQKEAYQRRPPRWNLLRTAAAPFREGSPQPQTKLRNTSFLPPTHTPSIRTPCLSSAAWDDDINPRRTPVAHRSE